MAENTDTCALYWRYPDLSGQRQAEGGLRLNDSHHTVASESCPVISVITVVYNRVETLERCILSVLGQNYPALEYIIIDGGSTDGTLDILRKYEQQIAYYVSEADEGIYDAMNKGLRLAHGDYIGLLNSDDFYAPGFLLAAAPQMTGGTEIIYGQLFWRDKQQIVALDDINSYAAAFSFDWLDVTHGTFLVQRSVYEALGPYSTELRMASDQLWINSALRQGISFDYLDHLAFFFTLGGVSSTSFQEGREERKTITRVNLPCLSEQEINVLYEGGGLFSFIKIGIALLKKYPKENDLYQAIFQYLQYQICYNLSQDQLLDFCQPLQEMEALLGQKLLPDLVVLSFDFAGKVAAWSAKNNISWLDRALGEYLNTQNIELRNSFARILSRYISIEQMCQYYRSKVSEPLGLETPVIPKLFVSLASKQIDNVSPVIESILRGTVRPEKILLWLDQEYFCEQELPSELLAQRAKSSGILEIRFCPTIQSYTKIIYSLQAFPKSIIVIANDDALYPPEWLELLHQSYLREPKNIHCHRAHAINFDANGKPMPYSSWDKEICTAAKSSLAHFFIGVGGVLFPPSSLHPDVLRQDLFLWLAPDAVDVWLNAMAVRQGSSVRLTSMGVSSLFGSSMSTYQCNGSDEEISLTYSYFGLWGKVFTSSLSADYLLARQEHKIKQIQHLQKAQIFTESKWHRFGQLSPKRKLWVIAKLLSKKLRIYSLLRPFARLLKTLLHVSF